MNKRSMRPMPKRGRLRPTKVVQRKSSPLQEMKELFRLALARREAVNLWLQSREQLSPRAIQTLFGYVERFQSSSARAFEQAGKMPLTNLQGAIRAGEGLAGVFQSHVGLINRRIAAERAVLRREPSDKRRQIIRALQEQARMLGEAIDLITQPTDRLKGVLERRQAK